jgi:hypothetical protein
MYLINMLTKEYPSFHQELINDFSQKLRCTGKE